MKSVPLALLVVIQELQGKKQMQHAHPVKYCTIAPKDRQSNKNVMLRIIALTKEWANQFLVPKTLTKMNQNNHPAKVVRLENSAMVGKRCAAHLDKACADGGRARG